MRITLKTLHNQVGDLDKRVGDLDKRVGDLDKRVGDLSNQVGDLDKRVERTSLLLEHHIKCTDQRFDKLSAKLNEHDARFDEILSAINRYADIIEQKLSNHENRITMLEGRAD